MDAVTSDTASISGDTGLPDGGGSKLLLFFWCTLQLTIVILNQKKKICHLSITLIISVYPCQSDVMFVLILT